MGLGGGGQGGCELRIEVFVKIKKKNFFFFLGGGGGGFFLGGGGSGEGGGVGGVSGRGQVWGGSGWM